MPIFKILTFSLIFIGATNLFAQADRVDSEDDLVQAVLQPVGSLVVKNATVELGELNQGASVEVRFPYGVSGDGPVKILGVHEDCGCLSSSLRPGQFLTQGTNGEVKVTLDTMAFAGPIDKTILVMTDEPRATRLHRLRIKAKIRRMVQINPPLVRFDWTKEQLPEEAVVTVRRLAQQTLSIEKVDFNRDNLDVDVKPVADSWQVRIRWKGDAPVQPFQEMIRISAGSPYGNLQIPVLGHVNAKP
ncbi:MAG: DUF1573 domain-containing protein [Proteobacteria bacterium]|nr:MAG: DUF1573 domain-containing protein [Pseudomonadota bacterium]